uniref:39S ribosomal protein L18, mitochondrial n=1 Tax=Aceria tosichella TaxID=561515 RepID=A0A6G1SDQ0_9ACAR
MLLTSKVLLRLRPSNHNGQLIRLISIDKLSNKKVTRLETELELEDDEFKGRLINRNPRNLEQMSFEKKPTGFWLDKSPLTDWNMIIFEQNEGHLHGYLRHWSGQTILQVSTSEPQLRKYFKSTSTVQAASTLGQILARRCLQSGYLCASVEEYDDDTKGIKRKAFFEAVKSNGVVLEESPEIQPRTATDL